MKHKLAQVTIVVRDYDEAIDWYKNTLGWRVSENIDMGNGKRWVVVKPPGEQGTALLLAKAATPAQAMTVGNQTGGRVFLFLHTDDCYRDYRSLKSKGVIFQSEPRQEEYGIVAVFSDLYGNRWDLIQRARKESMRAGLAKQTKANVIPCLRYRNAPVAIDWLCDVFGFVRHLVVPNPDGTIAHAQLSFGNGMIMLGSLNDNFLSRHMVQPDEIDGCQTQSSYVIVSDADSIYEKVLAAGAEIVMEIKDEDYGGRGFSCKDLEGHLWSFGTYDPWE